MLSCLAWRYGALPVLALVGLAAAVLALLWRAVLRTRNALGQLLGAACMAFLSGQLACNLLYNLGLCPFAGFFAFADCGNVMLCAQAALAGVVVSAFRQDPVTAGPAMGDLPAAAGVPGGRISYRDGVLTIRLRG